MRLVSSAFYGLPIFSFRSVKNISTHYDFTENIQCTADSVSFVIGNWF